MQPKPTTILLALAALGPLSHAAELRIGLIGLDSSHCLEYAKLLQDPANPEHVDGGKVVAAFKGGSPDVEHSASRVDGFTRQMIEKYGVTIYPTIGEMMGHVDAAMILSVDGRTHLPQARQAFVFRKPVFVDKPAGGTLAAGIELFRLARRERVPCFSASSLRFGPQIESVKSQEIGAQQGVFAYGPAPTEPHHPDLFWYGIHTVEAVYAVMGPGCRTVVRTHTPDADVVTGVWSDGRTATIRGVRHGTSGYGLIVFGSKKVVVEPPGHDYAPQLREIMKFFRTGVAPVSADETIETLAFMEAADESKRRGGCPVPLAEVIKTSEASLAGSE